MTNELEPLKECPFHKECIIPNIYHGFNDVQGDWARVECPVCGVSIEAEGIGDQRPIATALWNTRYKRTCHRVNSLEAFGIKDGGEDFDACSLCARKLYMEDAFCSGCGAEVVDGCSD